RQPIAIANLVGVKLDYGTCDTVHLGFGEFTVLPTLTWNYFCGVTALKSSKYSLNFLLPSRLSVRIAYSSLEVIPQWYGLLLSEGECPFPEVRRRAQLSKMAFCGPFFQRC